MPKEKRENKFCKRCQIPIVKEYLNHGFCFDCNQSLNFLGRDIELIKKYKKKEIKIINEKI